VCAARSLVDLDNLGVIRNDGAVLDRGHDQGDVHTRVVVLTIVVDNTSNKTIGFQHWESLEGLSSTHPISGFHVLRTGKEIVQLATGVVVGELPPRVDR
jgi:hypothetical protein